MSALQASLGAEPIFLKCPNCHKDIVTSINNLPGPVAYISGTVIALLGCWLGCCLLPCCLEECMEVHHTCPHCKAYLGKFRYMCA